jgi:hypothetical protein
MDRIRIAEISDFRGYNPARCNNGGAYGFWTTYRYIGGGKYQVEFNTTADFEYCSACGSFSCCCDGEHLVATDEDVWERIREAENDPSPDVYAKYELFPGDWVQKLRRQVRDAVNKTADERQLVSIAVRLGIKF